MCVCQRHNRVDQLVERVRTHKTAEMSDYEENDDFMCDDEEDYGLVSAIDIERATCDFPTKIVVRLPVVGRIGI